MLTAAHSLSTTVHTNGAWTLTQGRAITLNPREDGDIRIIGGSVWATLDGPHEGWESGPLGDLYLQAGALLAVRAGQHAVLEPFTPHHADTHPAQAVEFDWIPRPLSSAAHSWETAVGQPANDLGRALGDARHALSRLLRGVLTWIGERMWPHRPVAMACVVSSQPRRDGLRQG